ncbi:Hypothetical protein AA314_08883 [Archangium gephyra]|uniref:Uncharacterized protein n=1 Tax=Archangium gephyra TaxID=48 RepID=A0AAC8TID3_9BACT|nr:Hypothetical protein AA314_08883 [Archangium gephyra]
MGHEADSTGIVLGVRFVQPIAARASLRHRHSLSAGESR